MSEEKTYGLDRDNPFLRAEVVAARMGHRTARRFKRRGNQISASVVFAEPLADDLSRELRIDRGIALRVLDVLGDILTERATDGKPSGFPGFGTIFVRTRRDTKYGNRSLRRTAKLNVQQSVVRKISAQAPLTEKFDVQYHRAREAYLERKQARKQAIISSGRRRRNRNDERKRGAEDREG